MYDRQPRYVSLMVAVLIALLVLLQGCGGNDDDKNAKAGSDGATEQTAEGSTADTQQTVSKETESAEAKAARVAENARKTDAEVQDEFQAGFANDDSQIATFRIEGMAMYLEMTQAFPAYYGPIVAQKWGRKLSEEYRSGQKVTVYVTREEKELGKATFSTLGGFE